MFFIGAKINSDVYKIVDTSDMSTDIIDVKTILSYFEQGFDIFGLKPANKKMAEERCSVGASLMVFPEVFQDVLFCKYGSPLSIRWDRGRSYDHYLYFGVEPNTFDIVLFDGKFKKVNLFTTSQSCTKVITDVGLMDTGKIEELYLEVNTLR